MKAAVVILSDPKNGLEESAGRAFNALSAAYDFKRQGEDVTILFQVAGTRCMDEPTKADSLFHAVFDTVKDKVERKVSLSQFVDPTSSRALEQDGYVFSLPLEVVRRRQGIERATSRL